MYILVSLSRMLLNVDDDNVCENGDAFMFLNV